MCGGTEVTCAYAALDVPGARGRVRAWEASPANHREGEPELGRRSQKGRLPLRRDSEMNCDQHRSGIQSGFEGHPWVAPVGGGLGVDMAGLGQPPDQAGTDPDKHDDSRGEDGWPQPDPIGDESPK